MTEQQPSTRGALHHRKREGGDPVLWMILAGWLFLSPLVAVLVGKALARCEQEERAAAEARSRAGFDGRTTDGGRIGQRCRLRGRDRPGPPAGVRADVCRREGQDRRTVPRRV